LGARVTEYILNHNLSTEQRHILRARCLDFYIEGATQIQNRFDFSSSVLQNMELLNPHVIFNEDRESIMPLTTHFPNLVTKNNLQALDLEWRQLRNSNLKFDDNASICTFWLKVENEKYADTTPVYPLLSKFALNLLSLPHSSANVERIFSQVNLLKTKQRNRLSTSTICYHRPSRCDRDRCRFVDRCLCFVGTTPTRADSSRLSKRSSVEEDRRLVAQLTFTRARL
jgi:hypothetical protein